MSKIKIVSGDSDQILSLNISEFPSGSKIDLTGGSVSFRVSQGRNNKYIVY